jgi:hypothetical protein
MAKGELASAPPRPEDKIALRIREGEGEGEAVVCLSC